MQSDTVPKLVHFDFDDMYSMGETSLKYSHIATIRCHSAYGRRHVEPNMVLPQP